MIIKSILKKHLVVINVISSGGQVLLVGIIYFFLYKLLLRYLGVELLGVWSIVLATSSLANLANFGVADSVIRFVALFTKEGDKNKMHELIFTASGFLLGIFLFIAIVIYPFANLILNNVLPHKYVREGLVILPFSLLCLIINGVNGVFASVLDGMQRNYIRTLIFSTSSILLLFLSFILVPRFNLLGIAYAQVFQSLFTLISCFAAVVIQTNYNPLKWYWNKSIFKQIFGYGIKFQFISLAAMLNDPITKLLLGKFGGMNFVGYYEMANRLAMQARGVIISATQSLVPIMVNLSNEKDEIYNFFRNVISNVLFFSITSTCFLMLGGRLISNFWIGNYQSMFYYCLIILSFSLFINLLLSPIYFYYMSKANLNLLINFHVILGLLNLVFSIILGYFNGGFGVVYAMFLSIILSSVFLLFHFKKNTQINLKMLIKINDFYFLIFMSVVVVFSIFIRVMTNRILQDILAILFSTIIICSYFFKFKLSQIHRK